MNKTTYSAADSAMDKLMKGVLSTLEVHRVSTYQPSELDTKLRALADTSLDAITIAKRQGVMLANLANERLFTLNEIIALQSGFDVMYTDDAPEGGLLDPAYPTTGNPTILVHKQAHRAMQKKTLLDMYKFALDGTIEEQLYGTGADSMKRQEEAMREFTLVAAAVEAQLDEQPIAGTVS
ncbi:hypothetical protein [Mycobacteroides abscessus]|uniref:hypothetical protein n=1 Tax=Mycobacteroides abscessus TaxID=36809 RepID=UPI000C25AE39|nr:hypothetical protein [Mycobacteroides abscessus]